MPLTIGRYTAVYDHLIPFFLIFFVSGFPFFMGSAHEPSAKVAIIAYNRTPCVSIVEAWPLCVAVVLLSESSGKHGNPLQGCVLLTGSHPFLRQMARPVFIKRAAAREGNLLLLIRRVYAFCPLLLASPAAFTVSKFTWRVRGSCY